MNVQEAILRAEIDPKLTDAALGTLAMRAAESQAHDSSLAEGALPNDTGRQTGGVRRGRRAAGVHGYRVLTGGCWNRVIGVEADGRELVCKISPHADDEKIIREYAVLSAFARHTTLPVPRPLYLDRGAILPGTTLVMSRVPGEVMHHCFGLLGERDRARITDQIAEDLATLHRLKSHGFGGVEESEENRSTRWADFWLPRFDRVIEEAEKSGVVSESIIAGARELRHHFSPALDIGRESTMTHYDIWSGNVMIDVDRTPARVNGYIDIPGFYADYARELSFAMLFGVADRRFFATYLRHHQLDDGFELRANIYNLKMNIRHIQMYPSEHFYRRGAEENLTFIRRAL